MAAIKALVIGLGMLIVLAMTVLGYGLYQKSQNPDFKFFDLSGKSAAPVSDAASDEPAPPSVTATPGRAFGEVSLDLPEAARVISASANANRLVLVIARDGQNPDLVAVVDMTTGAVLGRVKARP
ncbi:MAG: hypothetical protein HQL36_05465 [Alphaproteobacteria bacterium]|nr:hypothetical protein [Alphaproteobacteria bacterium]MBF0250815.1 hypothetical protein [Alphaproteobacteria bacterium]